MKQSSAIRLRHSRRVLAVGMLAAAVTGISGCRTPSKPADFEAILPRFLLEAPAQAPTAQPVRLPTSGIVVPVFPSPVLTERHMANVELVRVELGLCLMFDCNLDGARNLLRVTGSNLGRRLVLTLNNAPFGARVIDGPISDGRLFVFVEMPDAQLTATAVDIKRTVQEVQAAIARGEQRRK